MKRVLLATAMLTLLFTACKKDDNKNNSGLGAGQFKIGTTTYSDVYLSTMVNSWLNAVSPTGGALQLSFYNGVLPSANKTYTVATDATSSDQIEIIAMSNVGGTSKTYAAGGTSGQTATVSVNNGKYTVKFDNVSATNIADNTETTQVSANISQ